MAIDRLPLATVAAIEFLPVIALAALGARDAAERRGARARRGRRLPAHATSGSPGSRSASRSRSPTRRCSPLYIVLGHRVAQHGAVGGIDGLAAAMLRRGVVDDAARRLAAPPALTDPVALAAGIGVGVTSSVIPYVCDQLAMARMPRATYALLVSLLPATATVIGLLVLAQIPTAREVAGVALVVAGLARPPRAGLADPRPTIRRWSLLLAGGSSRLAVTLWVAPPGASSPSALWGGLGLGAAVLHCLRRGDGCARS